MTRKMTRKMARTLRHMIGWRIPRSAMRASLVMVTLVVLAAVACSGDDAGPTATAVPATATAQAATAAPATSIPATATPPATESPGMTAALALPNIADTVERVRPTVVSIVAQIVTQDRFGRQQKGFGSGTGVIFDESGLVLTNNHVIEGSVEIIITQDDGTQLVAEVVGADRLSDLAVLKLPGDDFPALPFRQGGGLRPGDWVIAIGNALALPGGPTITVGVVSALGRSIESSPGVTLYDLIQTDTSINPGNSGGPLIDLAGNLVGINTAVLRGTGQGSISVEGIGFAIDADTAQQVAQQLIEFGRVRWAWMGVFLGDLVPEIAAEVGLPIREGVIMRDVVIDGPSDRAGIEPGDIVLTIGGFNVATVSDLTRLLKQEFTAGQRVEIEVFRTANGAGERHTLTLEFGERPQR